MRYSVTIALLALAGCAHVSDPNTRTMIRIESAVALPAESSSLLSYRRHYAWATDKPGVVDAVYVKGGKPKRLWLDHDELPVVLDGKCSVVSFSYDTATGNVFAMRCN